MGVEAVGQVGGVAGMGRFGGTPAQQDSAAHRLAVQQCRVEMGGKGQGGVVADLPQRGEERAGAGGHQPLRPSPHPRPRPAQPPRVASVDHKDGANPPQVVLQPGTDQMGGRQGLPPFQPEHRVPVRVLGVKGAVGGDVDPIVMPLLQPLHHRLPGRVRGTAVGSALGQQQLTQAAGLSLHLRQAAIRRSQAAEGGQRKLRGRAEGTAVVGGKQPAGQVQRHRPRPLVLPTLAVGPDQFPGDVRLGGVEEQAMAVPRPPVGSVKGL